MTSYTRPKAIRSVPRKSRAKRNLVADFETTTLLDDCRVWAWGATTIDNPDNELKLGLTLEDFLEWVQTEDSTCYFHNLKFDGMFIFDYLLNWNYEHSTDSRVRARGTFNTLISDMGQFYSITVFWPNGKMTEFRDSLKKIPMPVARIATAFELDEGKGDLDYKATRPVGYQPDKAEWDYIRRDVVIVAKAMREIQAGGMTRLTVASDAMAEYKSLTGGKMFEKLFPVLSDDMDSEIRRAYRGGFTYAATRFKGYRTRSGLVLDVNSLYPSVMALKPLPYAEPEFIEGRVFPTAERPLTIFSLTFTAKLKKDHIPCIQIKGSSMFGATEYLKEIREPTTLVMTDIDLALYQDHYHFEIISYGGGWRFKAASGMFDKYIDKWSKVKENAVGGKREIAKLHLNSLSGKFASNPNVTSKIPVLKDGIVRLVVGEPETRPPVYTAAGVFITSYARDITIRAAQANYSTFAYADTDSLPLLQDYIPDHIDIHPSRMGAWKHEYNFESAYYIRPKAYLERHPLEYHKKGCTAGCTTQHYTNAIAGLPVKVTAALTFDDLVEGRILKGKLAPKTVPGGIVLTDIDFKLKLS